MAEYNTKLEGHRGEAVRLMQLVELLTLPGRAGTTARKEVAAELRERAQAHFAASNLILREISHINPFRDSR